MKANQQSKALEGIKKEQLKRGHFTQEFKTDVVRYKKAENLTWAECGRQFNVLPKLVQPWEKQYEVCQLTAVAGRQAVSPEQAEIRQNQGAARNCRERIYAPLQTLTLRIEQVLGADQSYRRTRRQSAGGGREVALPPEQ